MRAWAEELPSSDTGALRHQQLPGQALRRWNPFGERDLGVLGDLELELRGIAAETEKEKNAEEGLALATLTSNGHQY